MTLEGNTVGLGRSTEQRYCKLLRHFYTHDGDKSSCVCEWKRLVCVLHMSTAWNVTTKRPTTVVYRRSHSMSAGLRASVATDNLFLRNPITFIRTPVRTVLSLTFSIYQHYYSDYLAKHGDHAVMFILGSFYGQSFAGFWSIRYCLRNFFLPAVVGYRQLLRGPSKNYRYITFHHEKQQNNSKRSTKSMSIIKEVTTIIYE